jgi:hypothetical protein
MVASVQKHATRERQEAGQEKKKNFQSLLAAVHEVAIEDVRVLRGR